MSLTHLLYESASGYALFTVALHDEVANSTKQFQESLADLNKFGKIVQLKSFAPFTSAAHALENANDVSEGENLESSQSVRGRLKVSREVWRAGRR
jgi:nucleolar protein 56